MRKKFTLLIMSAALLLGSGGMAWGQATPEDTWWGGYDCAVPNLTIGSNGEGTTSGGLRDFSEIGLLIDGLATHHFNLGSYGTRCNDPNPGDPGHTTHNLTIDITGTATPYQPLHFKYFQYDQPTWTHTWSWSWTGTGAMGCSSATTHYGSNSSGPHNVASATIAIQGGAIRLHDADAIKKLASMTSNLELPVSYTMKFDKKYLGSQGVAVSLNGALTAIGDGQGVGFYAGTDQTITFNGGSVLYLGPTSADQGTITVNTGTLGVNIKNYMGWTAGDTDNSIPDTHGVYLGGFTPTKITVGDGNLNIYNWNSCEWLAFANIMEPSITGNGDINIYTESADSRLPAVDARTGRGYKSVINGGTIDFEDDAIFDFGSNTGNFQVVGQSVTFAGVYTYLSAATTPLHEISANSLNAARNAIGTCGIGDIWFQGAVTVEKKDGNTNWFATQDIITDVSNAPVSYEMSGTTNTKWHADRDINMGSSVTFEQTAAGTGDITWRAERDILTNRGCSSDNGFALFDIKGTADVLLNAERDIHTKGRVDFIYAPTTGTGTLSMISDTGNIQAERPLTIEVNHNDNDILISAESTPGIDHSKRNLGNIYTYDSVRITRNNAVAGKTEILSQNDIRTAMVDIENTVDSANTYLIESHQGDIWFGHNDTTSNPSGRFGTNCLNPAANEISYDLNNFTYTAPGNSSGWLHVYAGFGDQNAGKIPWGGGNIRFTHINETLGNTSNHPTEFKIPFSNWYICGNTAHDDFTDYEQAGIIGGVARCAITNKQPDPLLNTLCTDTGLIYRGFNGELLFDAGTRGNIIINNGSFLTFQGGTGNAKFLTRWGDIDMRYPFDVDSMKGSLLFLANSELPNKLNTGNCTCEEKRNNVYLQDFQYIPVVQSGSIFVGADNNIKLQYGGLKGSAWNTNQRDPFYSGDAGYPCGTNYHCDSDTSVNQARDLILNFNKTTVGTPTTITSGGFAAVASDLIDVYTYMEYTGGTGSGMSSVPGYGNLHGENVAGYGLYIKTQGNKKNWDHSAFDLDIDACWPPKCDDPCTNSILQNTARVTFHSDARIYTENQRTYIGSPVLETYGNLDLNTHQNKAGKTSITIQTDSLIVHDSLILDGKLTRFTTWSGLYRDMPIFKLGHHRFTPPVKEDGCKDCFIHQKETGKKANRTALDTLYVTFRNGASVPRLHTLVADHAVLSFLTDSFDHVKGDPTINAKFYTDTFKVRNHVELYTDAKHERDGHFELISEAQMDSKDYAGIYARHLHMEPAAPECDDYSYSQLWMPDLALDVITTSTFGGYGWIHADVHVEIEATLAPGYASLRTKGDYCNELKAGTLKMQDLRLDKGAELRYSIGHEPGFDGELADCIEVDEITMYGSVNITVEKRCNQRFEEGCYPIIRYNSVAVDTVNLNNLKLKTLKIDGYRLSLDTSIPGVVYLCVGETAIPEIRREVYIPRTEGVTLVGREFGTHYIASMDNFKFTAKYTTPEPLKVTTNRLADDGTAEELIGTLNANGEYEYVIRRVQQNIVLKFGPEYATDNELIDGRAVWSHNNTIYIRVEKEDVASIYSVAGQMVKRIDLSEGSTPVSMERGIYIVTLKDGSVHKVIVK